MIGPGKYDDLTTEVRERTKAEGVILIVLKGDRGSGFSCQANVLVTMNLPEMLRSMADEIEQDMRQ